MSLQFQNILCFLQGHHRSQYRLATSLSRFGIALLDFAEKFKNMHRDIPANRNQKPILKKIEISLNDVCTYVYISYHTER